MCVTGPQTIPNSTDQSPITIATIQQTTVLLWGWGEEQSYHVKLSTKPGCFALLGGHVGGEGGLGVAAPPTEMVDLLKCIEKFVSQLHKIIFMYKNKRN